MSRHIESRSTVFGTALNYIVLRLFGVEPDHPMMLKARATLHTLGGASAIPSWGKMWLACLNLYSWDGFNSVPAELWLLPEFLPIHPSRWWIHTRAVYVPMSWLYGRRYQMPLNPMLKMLRTELFTEPFDSIDWPSCRNKCAAVDLYAPHPPVLDALFRVLNLYERWICPSFLRRRGMARAYELMCMDDEHTACQTLAPVSGPLSLVCRFIVEGTDSPAVRLHQQKIRDFMWMSKDGMMACGTNGSQLWDTALTCQAIVGTGLAAEPAYRTHLAAALRWLDDCQIRQNPVHMARAYRHPTKGAWPFSTREQGYTVSDCTSEALKAVMWLQEIEGLPQCVSEDRLQDAIDIVLSLQNPSGGFSSYEPIRAPLWNELLNPAEVFADIMTEYAYPECTSACVTALGEFARRHPTYRAAEIARARAEGIRYLHASQRPEGGWFGSWAICFTYATWYVLGALGSVGETHETSERVRRACTFLLDRQMGDGGWGESYLSCERGVYVQHAESQVVNTSWAVLALLNAKCPDRAAIKRGCQLIMSRQQPDGSWKQEAIEGVFNRNCAISYPSYKHVFTIWALGRAARELLSNGETW